MKSKLEGETVGKQFCRQLFDEGEFLHTFLIFKVVLNLNTALIDFVALVLLEQLHAPLLLLRKHLLALEPHRRDNFLDTGDFAL